MYNSFPLNHKSNKQKLILDYNMHMTEQLTLTMLCTSVQNTNYVTVTTTSNSTNSAAVTVRALSEQ